MVIGLDTETSGLDFRHGARPYIVTIYDSKTDEHILWQWDVDPLTRKVTVPESDINDIEDFCSRDELFILQNPKFDVLALSTLRKSIADNWQWDRTRDTLLAAHMLGSNEPKDLTTLAVKFLAKNISPYEKAMEEATKKARNICRRKAFVEKHGLWALANEDRMNVDMPSVKGSKSWHFDTWLPRAVAKAEGYLTGECRVVNRHKEKFDVYIGRGTFWGNEFVIGRDGTREEAIEKYRVKKISDPMWLERLKELDGKTLGCSCKPQDCHGDVIAEELAKLRHAWWDVSTNYAQVDPWVTVGVYKEQMRWLEEQDLLEIYEKVRLKLLPIIFSMETNGITLNKRRLQEQTAQYKAESKQAEAACLKIAEKYNYDLKLPKSGNNHSLTKFAFGEEKLVCSACEPDFNEEGFEPTSYLSNCRECGKVSTYYRKPNLGLPAIKRSKKTGKPSLDKVTLENYQLSLEDPDELEFVTNLMGKRKRDTAVGYLDSYQRYWIKVPGRFNKTWYILYSSLNPCGTDTLRFSSHFPNEQNISKKEGFNLRYVFGPMPGREWWSVDAQNIELRIPAYESEEEELIDLFERADEPPYYGSTHLLNFSTVYPDIWADALKHGVWEWEDENQGKRIDETLVGPYCKKKYASTYYQWCKNGDFAVQYGAVERTDRIGTADAAFHRQGSHALLKARFSKLDKLNEKCIKIANRTGYIETLPDRTINPRRGYPLRCSRSQYGDIIPTTPLNYHVSGTAMWVMCRIMLVAQEYLDKVNSMHGGDYKIILQVHDELVFDFPKRDNRKIIKNLIKIMGSVGYDLIPSIPLPVSAQYHPHTWSEGVEFK